MEYTHINDCWRKIREVSDAGELTLEKLNNLLDNFPRWSGDWSIHYVDEHTIEVENSYYDSSVDDWDSDFDTFDINLDADEIAEHRLKCII